MCDFANVRLPGMRIKHRVQQNWIKMYDKAGVVLRVETVIKRIGKRRRGWQGGGLCLLSTRLAERRSEQPVSSREASDNARRPASGARGAGPRGGRAIESLRGAERS
jgi:hypothetical protein